MNKKLILLVSCFLGACGGGSGGKGPNLTPAEHLFGAGIGTGATPSHLIPREDGEGYEILSFGAWGNVYDIKRTTNGVVGIDFNHKSFSNNSRIEVFDFLGQQKQDISTNYKSLKDASVEKSTFVGPAIVYMEGGYCGSRCFSISGSDYGTMKLQFGRDIDNATIEFVMSNPDNNLVVTKNSDDLRFTSDRQNVVVTYETANKAYIGYGAKQ